MINPHPENIYIAQLCLAVTAICVFGVYQGLRTGRPPGQKGIKGTPLADNKKLMIIQVTLLTLLMSCSTVVGIMFWRAAP